MQIAESSSIITCEPLEDYLDAYLYTLTASFDRRGAEVTFEMLHFCTSHVTTFVVRLQMTRDSVRRVGYAAVLLMSRDVTFGLLGLLCSRC